MCLINFTIENFIDINLLNTRNFLNVVIIKETIMLE